MVFTVCIVLYDLTLRLVLAARDGVVAPALCGRPRRNSTGCSTSHKFGRTFVIALVFEQNSGHSPILPLATWFDRHEELSWELVSSQQSKFNPFQSISMSRSNQRSFPLTFLCSGGERPDQSTRNQCVSHTHTVQWYSVSSVQEICSLPGRWSILKNSSMGLKALKKEWSIVARHNDVKQLHRYPTAWFCIFNLEGTQLIPLSDARIVQSLLPTKLIQDKIVTMKWLFDIELYSEV